MKRTQVQLDEATYLTLKQKAFERGMSMSAFLRELLHRQFSPALPRNAREFRFVGSGQSDQRDLAPISERHDEALAEDFAE